MKAARAQLTMVVLLALGGCGFHLQGRADLPKSFAAARIDAPDPQSEFAARLAQALRGAGARLDGDAAPAAVVHVLEDHVGERVLTVSARNIPTALEVSYSVKVAVEYQGREILPAEEHVLRREYSFDEREVLAKQRERDDLVAALADDLVALMMRRFDAL
jgi:LPS-assembly lipoprotein